MYCCWFFKAQRTNTNVLDSQSELLVSLSALELQLSSMHSVLWSFGWRLRLYLDLVLLGISIEGSDRKRFLFLGPSSTPSAAMPFRTCHVLLMCCSRDWLMKKVLSSAHHWPRRGKIVLVYVVLLNVCEDTYKARRYDLASHEKLIIIIIYNGSVDYM